MPKRKTSPCGCTPLLSCVQGIETDVESGKGTSYNVTLWRTLTTHIQFTKYLNLCCYNLLHNSHAERHTYSCAMPIYLPYIYDILRLPTHRIQKTYYISYISIHFSSPLLPRNVSWGMPWAAHAVSAAHSYGASSKLCWAAPVILVESYCQLVCFKMICCQKSAACMLVQV